MKEQANRPKEDRRIEGSAYAILRQTDGKRRHAAEKKTQALIDPTMRGEFFFSLNVSPLNSYQIIYTDLTVQLAKK